LGASKPKGLNRIAEIIKGNLCLREENNSYGEPNVLDLFLNFTFHIVVSAVSKMHKKNPTEKERFHKSNPK
jgi:hypothetical protein